MNVKLLLLLYLFIPLLILPPSARANNLLRNPSFEQLKDSVPAYWEAKHSTTFFTATDSASKQGSRSAVISKKNNKSGWTYAYQDVEATPSAVYKLSGWIKWLVGAVSKAALKIDWLGIEGKRVASKSSTDEVILSLESADFQYLEMVKEAPVETKSARIELFVNLKEGEAVPSVYFDDLSFSEFYGQADDDDAPQISFELVDEVTAGEEFTVNLMLKNYSADAEYKVKFLAGREGDFYSGRTKGAEEEFLAWNASWLSFPIVKTDGEGNCNTEITAQIDSDAESGEYSAKIRLRDAEDSNLDSEEKALTVLSAVESGVGEGEETELSLISIAAARSLDLGSEVRLRGFVTAPPGVFADNQFYFADESGGILVKGSLVENNELVLGDEVEVGCSVEEAWNEKYIKLCQNNHLAVVGSGADAPAPTDISTGDVSEDYEGQLVSVAGKIAETSGSTFYLDDGSGKAKIYVKSSTAIELPGKKVGDKVTVVGIVSQWGMLKDGSANYRIMPRFDSDLTFSTANKVEGEVLGVERLPVTGVGLVSAVLDISAAFLLLGVGLRLLIPKTSLIT